MTAPYQAFRCADGYITIGAANDRNFAKLARRSATTSGSPTRASPPITQRVAHRDELARLIEAVTVNEPRAFWLAELEQAGIPCGPILDYDDALTTPQAIAREMTVDVDHPTLGPLRTLGTPIKMSATPLNPRRRGPMLGEHTDDVLAEAGYSGDEIEQLRYCRRRRLARLRVSRFGATSSTRYWTPPAFSVDHNVVITLFVRPFPRRSST